MYLSRLEIQGFKSFAHTTSLDFQTGITAIVGPNGSGKSNVADAVRWVLGEQSLKLLRGKRSDDVIFAGSDKKSRLGVAEVSLFLNNEDRGAPIDYSELVISRRVFRDGQGEYLINRQPARLQDIQLLLARANFGQRTYSVIGQGMIDSFLISSPQERKHLFDEAAGVRQYQLKKDQALQKLARSKENLVQGEAIMAEIEPRLRSLTRQVRRLERREEVEKKLGGQQRLYFGLRWQEITQEQSQTKAEWTKHDSQRQGVAKELAAIQAELEGMERERSASEVFAGLQKEYNRILDQKNRLLQDQAIIKGQLEVAAKQAGRAENVYRQQRVEEVKRSLVSAEEELEVVEQLVKRAQTTLDKQSTELKQVDLRFNKIEEDLTKLSAGRQGTIWTMISATTKKIRQAFHALSTDLAGDAPNIEKLRQQSDRLNKDLENLSTQVESADEKDAAASLAEQQRALIDLSRERQRIVEHVAEARSELGRAEDQQQRLNDSRRLLQTEFDKLQKESSVIELAKTDPEAAYTVYVQQAQELEKKIAVVDEELKSARAAINNFNSSETSKKERLFALQKEFRDTQHRLNTITTLVNEVQVRLARLEQRQDDLRHEITQAMTAEAVTVIEAEANKELSGDITLLAEEIGHLQHQLQLIGGIDEQITEEYHSTNERWEFLNKQSEDLHA
ncbi:MAG: AAA family ATPase, partial [Candidatus Kerfeldbacteria bacterium]|nr:AAA family ATPase [Candidatus Kerfeldbacteria bacterium]